MLVIKGTMGEMLFYACVHPVKASNNTRVYYPCPAILGGQPTLKWAIIGVFKAPSASWVVMVTDRAVFVQ